MREQYATRHAQTHAKQANTLQDRAFIQFGWRRLDAFYSHNAFSLVARASEDNPTIGNVQEADVGFLCLRDAFNSCNFCQYQLQLLII